MINIFLVFIISASFFIAFSIIATSLLNGISPMPTSPKVKRKVLEVLPERKRGANIYEMGSGWGSLAFPLAKRFPGGIVKAYENSLFPYFFSVLRHYLFPLNNLAFYKRNFFSIPLNDADLVVCYLYPSAMHRLKNKFEEELPLDCYVLSHTFAVPGWLPDQVFEAKDLYRTKIYLYKREKASSEKLIFA